MPVVVGLAVRARDRDRAWGSSTTRRRNASARDSTGMSRRRASTTSGFVSRTAVEIATASQLGRHLLGPVTDERRDPFRRRAARAASTSRWSEPLTRVTEREQVPRDRAHARAADRDDVHGARRVEIERASSPTRALLDEVGESGRGVGASHRPRGAAHRGEARRRRRATSSGSGRAACRRTRRRGRRQPRRALRACVRCGSGDRSARPEAARAPTGHPAAVSSATVPDAGAAQRQRATGVEPVETIFVGHQRVAEVVGRRGDLGEPLTALVVVAGTGDVVDGDVVAVAPAAPPARCRRR